MTAFPTWWSSLASSVSLDERQMLAVVAAFVLLLILSLRASQLVRMAVLAGTAVFVAWPAARLVCLASGGVLATWLLLARWLGGRRTPPKPY